MIPHIWLEQAAERISVHIQKTPLEYDEENKLFLKWENLQTTGSFKARGAFNKVLTLQPWERERGIVTASAGNHGQGVALAGKLVDSPITVFVSENASPIKIQAIHGLGAEIKLVPGGYGESEQAGLEFARQHGKTWLSAYNDGQVIAGQGTLALEILSDIPECDHLTWVVPCGGGGLLSGVALAVNALKQSRCKHRVIGVQSVASPFMFEIYNRRPQEGVKELPSLADGLAGPVEKNSLTIPIVRNYIDEMVLVSEEEIIQAMAFAWNRYRQRIEPSAAVSLASILSGKVTDRPAVIILTGGNIQVEQHENLIRSCTLPE